MKISLNNRSTLNKYNFLFQFFALYIFWMSKYQSFQICWQRRILCYIIQIKISKIYACTHFQLSYSEGCQKYFRKLVHNSLNIGEIAEAFLLYTVDDTYTGIHVYTNKSSTWQREKRSFLCAPKTSHIYIYEAYITFS